MNGISERLKQLRGSLSQQKFAESVELKQTTYGQYERGVTSPSTETASMICQKLGLNPRWLILGEEPMYDAEASQERPRIKGGDVRKKPLSELPADMQQAVKKIAKGAQAWRQRWDELPDWAKDHIMRLEEELDTAREDLLKAKDEALRAQEIALQTLQERAAKRRAEMLEELRSAPVEQIIEAINTRGFTVEIDGKTYPKK